MAQDERTFAVMLRDARTNSGFTQDAVSAKAKVSQSSYSEWEQGRRLPESSREDAVLRLADTLRLDPTELLRALERERRAARSSSRPCPTAETYLPAQERFLEECLAAVPKDHTMEIWLIGPETLPVLNEPSAEQAWADNLALGINYKVVWLLDLVDPHRLEDVLGEVNETFNDIEDDLATKTPVPGTVVHYPTSAFFCTEDDIKKDVGGVPYRHLQENWELYKSLRLKAPPHCRFEDIKLIEHRSISHQILGFTSELTTIAVYCPAKRIKDGRTEARTLVGVSPRSCVELRHEGETYFFTTSHEQAREIRRIIVAFDRDWQAANAVENIDELLRLAAPIDG